MDDTVQGTGVALPGASLNLTSIKLKSGLASVEKLWSVISILIHNVLGPLFEPHDTVYACVTVESRVIGPTVISRTGECALGTTTTMWFEFSRLSSSSFAIDFCWAKMHCSSSGFWKTGCMMIWFSCHKAKWSYIKGRCFKWNHASVNCFEFKRFQIRSNCSGLRQNKGPYWLLLSLATEPEVILYGQ